MIELDVPARLRRAILENDVLLVKRILKNNPACLENPDFEDRSNTSLHLAAVKGHLYILKLLISLGHDSCTPNIDRTGYDSAPGISLNVDCSTALHLAAAHSHPDCVDLLCRTFPHVIDWKDKDGKTALMLAAQSSNPAHVPVNTTRHVQASAFGRGGGGGGGGGGTGRPRAASGGSATAEEDIATIAILISHNASLTATDHLGNTALHHASAWGNLKAVRALLSAGAPPLPLNKANHTPLDYSVTKQAAQYFQSIVNDLDNWNKTDDQQQQQQQQQQQPRSLKLNTVAAIATPPSEQNPAARRLGSPMSSPVKTRSHEQIINASPIKTSFGGLRLVIDTESADRADIDDVPSTAKRIEPSPIE